MAILDLNEADVVEAAKKQPQETTLAAECTSRHLRTAEQALVNVSMDQGVEISQDVRLSTVMRKATESVKHAALALINKMKTSRLYGTLEYAFAEDMSLNRALHGFLHLYATHFSDLERDAIWNVGLPDSHATGPNVTHDGSL